MKKISLTLLILTLMMITPSASAANVLTPSSQGFIEGYLSQVFSEGSLVIETYAGNSYFVSTNQQTSLTIDNIPVFLNAFKPGMEVTAVLTAKGVVSLEGYSTANLGYLEPGGKVRTGRISKIDRNQIWVVLPTGEEKLYFTSPATLALKNGQRTALNVLYEGDRVKLFFDQVDSKLISRLQIEGESIMIKDLYKGRINVADGYEPVLALENVQVFRNNDWQDYQISMSMPYADDHPIYLGGYRIPRNNLKYYRGSTIYMAVKDFFGREQVERIVLKNQYESLYSDKIESINWYTEAFELANNKNFSFHDGTIIIKDGRLVDKYGLNPQADVLVVADGRGDQRQADLIYVYNKGINNSNIGYYQLYAGRLDTIIENKLWLKDFFLLNNNDWESFTDEKELFYDYDTYIYDFEDRSQISPREFFAKDYAVDEKSDYVQDNNLRDWYGYLYTDGDRIVSIIVMKNMDSLLRQRITNGIIEDVVDDPLVGWTIVIQNASDWSTRHEQWMAKNTAVRVNLEDALLIKGEQVISAEDLKPGSHIYLVRDDFAGKILLVK